jgi:hypothetical protein
LSSDVVRARTPRTASLSNAHSFGLSQQPSLSYRSPSLDDFLAHCLRPHVDNRPSLHHTDEMTNATSAFEMKTIGHATLIVSENGVPLVATDPWLLGSVYWRSWWLEKYPTFDEVEMVRQAKYIYVTHSHPDHFHWPTLRQLGPKKILNPRFPRYDVIDFLRAHNYPCDVLEPFRWYAISDNVRICSVPVPIDDSILIIETPKAVIVNINDSVPRNSLLLHLRKHLIAPNKTVIVLRSYSPASVGATTYREGKRIPLKTKQDFARVAQGMAETVGAKYFIPFASQAFFNRTDSTWANEHKVIYEDLVTYWTSTTVALCKPFVTMDLDTFEHSSDYSGINRQLEQHQLQKVRDTQAAEAEFHIPDDLDRMLKDYLDEIYFARTIYRRGIGWRLTTSHSERFYDTRTRRILHAIPPGHDFVISLPDRVLYEALQNGILTDLGITLFVRIDTKISLKRTYAAFLLMGLHDYGHFKDKTRFTRFVRFYVPYVFPQLLSLRSNTRGANALLSSA